MQYGLLSDTPEALGATPDREIARRRRQLPKTPRSRAHAQRTSYASRP